MKVFVNAATLVVGGGIQIGISFIQMAIKEKEIQWLFAVSKGIMDGLSEDIKQNCEVVCIDPSPAGIFSGKASREKIKRLVAKFDADMVYSIGFPSYIQFKQVEIGRYTNPWEINAKPLPWQLYPSLKDKVKITLGIWYRQWWARKARYIETQTEAAKTGIAKRVRFPKERIMVIPNSPNAMFLKEAGASQLERKYIFCLAAPYPHKNLRIIPQVALALKNMGHNNYPFVLTLPMNHTLWKSIENEAKQLEVTDLVMNVGKLSLADCLDYYRQSVMVFLPTLMEIFSATYVEAMAMKVPIVTSDLDFARDNCGDAAEFCAPDDVTSASEGIAKLLNDPALREALVRKGSEKLASYPNNELKYQRLFDWFKEINTK